MILSGDCFHTLRTLDPGAAQGCVTSPPYYGLRDYGVPPTEWPETAYLPMPGLPPVAVPAMTCALGLEPTPEAFIAHLVLIFREVRRVLPDDGAMLLNIGDSYATGPKTGDRSAYGSTIKQGAKLELMRGSPRPAKGGVPKKNLLGIPWRLAFALQADGWVLRQEIIWAKDNPMPESVKDRCTKAHEQVFLLTKQSKGYYWGYEDLAEPVTASSIARLSQDVDAQAGSDRVPGKTNGPMKAVSTAHLSFRREGSEREQVIPGQSVGTHRPDRAESSAAVVEQFMAQAPRLSDMVGRASGNKTHKHSEAYAQGDEFSRLKSGLLKYGDQRAQLIRALELAEQHGLTREHLEALRAVGLGSNPRRAELNTGTNTPEVLRLADEARAVLGSYAQEFLTGTTRNARTVWTISTIPFKEAHFAVMSPALAERMVLAVTPLGGTVLDPFFGAGTTGIAALKHGREYIGCELSPANVGLCKKRIRRAQPGLGLGVRRSA